MTTLVLPPQLPPMCDDISKEIGGVVTGTERKPELVRTDIVYICMLGTCQPTSPHVVSVCELSKKEPGVNLHGSYTPNALRH